jgi:hypothetical protein
MCGRRRFQQRIASKVIVARIIRGRHPHANYHDLSGYSGEHFPGSRHRRTGKGCRPEATPARSGIAIFRRVLALPCWARSVRNIALLGQATWSPCGKASFLTPTTWNEFLPMSMPTAATALLRLGDMGVLLVVSGAPLLDSSLAGQEHGRAIPLTEIDRWILLRCTPRNG